MSEQVVSERPITIVESESEFYSRFMQLSQEGEYIYINSGHADKLIDVMPKSISDFEIVWIEGTDDKEKYLIISIESVKKLIESSLSNENTEAGDTTDQVIQWVASEFNGMSYMFKIANRIIDKGGVLAGREQSLLAMKKSAVSAYSLITLLQDNKLVSENSHFVDLNNEVTNIISMYYKLQNHFTLCLEDPYTSVKQDYYDNEGFHKRVKEKAEILDRRNRDGKPVTHVDYSNHT